MCKTLKERFLNNKLVQDGCEESTIYNYDLDIRLFYDYMSKEKNIPVEHEEKLLKSVTRFDIDDYRDYMLYKEIVNSKGEHSSVSRVNRIFTTLKQYSKFLKEGLVIENDFMAGVGVVKPNTKNKDIKPKKEKELINKDDFNKLIRATYREEYFTRNYEFNSTRTRFLLALMATTGQRIETLLQVELNMIEKVSDDAYMINIPKEITKCDRAVRVPIANKTFKYYNEYITEREKLNNIIDSHLLFLSERGKKFDRRNSADVINKLCDIAKIEKHISNHNMRAFFRTQSSFNGVNENIIKLIGGWKNNDKMADIYVKDDHSYEMDMKKIKACNII